MAAMVILGPGGQELRVGMAARADHVVHAAAVRIETVPGERVVGDRRHGPQMRERAPEPVAGAHMRGVQRARLAGEEALRKIVRTPQVEIADLRTLDADDPEDVTGRHFEGARLARQDDGFGDLGQVAPDVVVERAVTGWEPVDRIDDDWAYGAALCGVEGS